ncbi:hemolysin III [Candidatus Nanopelagicus abundans]|jgi:hemolysin III|uniref:Hemolysin III n=1 Tax=Candidatus Nanopelagicus abundans TaxID=1884916 RepID=A0A249L2Z3_9ACTN|nr:hemolysin III family protein [Candidatus Nanopelagicus abundans]ASY23422.1 hemolysin III [Candidatus Nanopelagicus abundans]
MEKPKLRGIVHLVMSPLSLVAGLILITLANELRGRITLGIFTLTAVTLFTCSALYHRVAWNDKNKAIWRRIDHSNISILIAGTYTPFAVYLLQPSQTKTLLIVAWGGAILISLLRIFWLSAPRWLYVAGYISLGWAAVFYMPAFFNSGGVAIFILILTGGLLYSAGGVIYALKKPNFSISWFGFHELFHALTAAAFICHFVAAILTVFSNR